MRQFLFALALLVFPSFTLAQQSVLEEPKIRETITPVALAQEQAEPEENAVLEIMQGEHVIGRGVLVKSAGSESIGVTAYHVIFPSERMEISTVPGKTTIVAAPLHVNYLKVKFRSGLITDKARFAYGDKNADWAVFRVEAPENAVAIEAGEVSKTAKFYTYDIHWKRHEMPFRHFVDNGLHVIFDRDAVTGESGGPVFSNGKVVAIVSGGWRWVDHQYVPNRSVTYPLKAGIIKREFFPR